MQDRAKNHTFEEWERIGKLLDARANRYSEHWIDNWTRDRTLLEIIDAQYNQIERLRSDVIDLQRTVEDLAQQVYQND